VAPFGHPTDAAPERFHLIAPHESDVRKWEKLPWIDEYSEKRYRVSASHPSATRSLARVKSYDDVLEDYEFHEEAKCADASGAPCDRQSVGLLSRRHVRIEKMHFIARSRISWRRLKSSVSWMPPMFTQNILISGAVSGRREFSQRCGESG
jgi:hypothetical protein